MNLEKDFEIYRFKLGKLYGKLSFFPESLSFVSSGNKKDKNGNLRGNILKLQEYMKNYNELKEKENEIVNKKNEESKEFEKKKSKLDLKEKTPENANTGTTKKEKKQVDKLEKQIKYSEQQIKKLNDKAEKIKKKISDLLAKMSDYDDNNLNSIIKDIKNSIENKKPNIADESIEKFSEKIPKFDDNQLSKNFNKISILAKEYDELKKDYDELKQKKELDEKYEEKLDEKFNNLSTLKTKITKLLNTVKVKGYSGYLDSDIAKIKSKFDGKHPKETLSKIFDDFTRQSEELKYVSNNLNESSDFIKKDLQNIDKLNEEIQIYENNLKKLDNDIRSKKESGQKNKESMEILKNQLKQLDKNTQKEDIQRLEKEIEEKNQANQKYEKSIIELEQKRKNWVNELDKKQKELSQLNEKRLKLIQNLKDIRNSGRYSEISDGVNYLCMNLEFADLKKRKKMITDVDKCMKRISNDLKELKRYRSWFFKKDNVAKTAYKFSFDLYRSIKKDLKQNDNFDDLFSVYDKLLMASSYIRDAIKARILEKKLHNNESDFTRNVLKSLYDNFSNLCIIIFNKSFPEIAYDFESLKVGQSETIEYYKKLIKSDLKKLYKKTSGIFRKYNAAKILYTCLSKFDIDNLGLGCKSNIKNDAIVKIKEGIESRRKEIIDRAKSKKKEVSDNDFRNDETLTIMYRLLEDFVNVGKSLKIDVDVDLEDLDEGLEIDEQTARNYQAGMDVKIAELSKPKEKIKDEIEKLKGNVKDKIGKLKENLKNQISKFLNISYTSYAMTYYLDLSKNQTVSSKCEELNRKVEELKFDDFLQNDKAHEKFKTWGENFSKNLDTFVINLKKIAEEEFEQKNEGYSYKDYNIEQSISGIQSDIEKIVSETYGYLENNSKNIFSKTNKCKEYSKKIDEYKKDSEKIFKEDSKIKLCLRNTKGKIEELKDSLRDKIRKFERIPYTWYGVSYTLDLSKNDKISSKCQELTNEVGKLKFNDFLKDKKANENFKKWGEKFLTHLEKFISDLKEIAQNECQKQRIDYKSCKIEEIILKIQQDIQNSISETSKYFEINIKEILPEMDKPEWKEISKNYSQGRLRLRAVKGAKILGDVVTSFFIPGANVGRVVVTLEGVKLAKKIAGTSGVDKSSIVILVSETDIDCKLFKVASSSPAKLRVYLTLSSPLLLNMLNMAPDGTRIVDCIGNLDIQNNFRSGKIYFHPYGGHVEKYEGEKEDSNIRYDKKKMALKEQKDYGKSKQIMKEIKAKIAELKPSMFGKVFKSDITKSVYEPINHIYKNFRKSLKSASADDVESKEFLRAAKSFVFNKMSDFSAKNEEDYEKNAEKYKKINQYLGELFGKLVDLEKYMFGYESELKSSGEIREFMDSQDRAKIFGEILAASDLLGMGALIFTIENATLKGLMSAGNEHFMPGRNSYVACVADLNIKMTLDSYLEKKEDEGYGKSITKNILAFVGTSGVTANIISGGVKMLGFGEGAGMVDTFASFLSILGKGIRIRTYVSVDNFTFATKMINITTKLQKGKIKLIK